MTIQCVPAEGPVLQWSKGRNSIGKMGIAGVLRLRATSAVSCDKSARRSAQNDGLCDFRIIGVDWARYTDCASVLNVGAPIEASSLSALTLKSSCTSTIVESS